MPKRFTDTDIWKRQRWFRKLRPEYKLAFLYIKDQCDHAGIWNIDCTDLIEDIGLENFDIAKFVKECNAEYNKTSGKLENKERLRILNKGYIWVTGFIQFQYKGRGGLVNHNAAPVITALQILDGFNLLKESINKGYITLTDGYVTAKDKDKEKDMYLEDKNRGAGKGKETFNSKNNHHAGTRKSGFTANGTYAKDAEETEERF